LSLAELAVGIAAPAAARELARRRRHLRKVERVTIPLDFDRSCAGAYEHICAVTFRIGRKVRGSRSIDLMIAATALAHDLPLYTLNAADLRGLDGLIEIVDLS
jgi:predicted nucleic acid-binding protein